MQKPSLGRFVHCPVRPAPNNGSPTAPALITRVWNDGMVNVQVIGDGWSEWKTSVTFYQSETAMREATGYDPDDPDKSDPPHACYWPDRVL